MIAHVSGVPVEELLLWALPGGTALLVVRAYVTLLIARGSELRRTALTAAFRVRHDHPTTRSGP